MKPRGNTSCKESKRLDSLEVYGFPRKKLLKMPFKLGQSVRSSLEFERQLLNLKDCFQIRIPFVLMQGGTIQPSFFMKKDLPSDPSLRDRIILAADGAVIQMGGKRMA